MFLCLFFEIWLFLLIGLVVFDWSRFFWRQELCYRLKQFFYFLVRVVFLRYGQVYEVGEYVGDLLYVKVEVQNERVIGFWQGQIDIMFVGFQERRDGVDIGVGVLFVFLVRIDFLEGRQGCQVWEQVFQFIIGIGGGIDWKDLVF